MGTHELLWLSSGRGSRFGISSGDCCIRGIRWEKIFRVALSCGLAGGKINSCRTGETRCVQLVHSWLDG
jgi:hypothetical protein